MKNRSEFPSCRTAAVISALSILTIVAAAKAQGDQATLVQQAYDSSKDAKTLDEFNAALVACKTASDAELTDAQHKYVDQLAAWVHNKRGEYYANQAVKLSDDGKTEQATEMDAKALAEFEVAVEKDSNKWQAVHNRGVSYAAAGRFAEALKDFDRVVQLRIGFTKGWFNRGEANYSLGRYDDAISDYTTLLRLNPNDSAAYVSRGHAYFQMREFDQALSDYSMAVSLQPNDALLRANRADAYQSLRMWQQAADDYRLAVDMDNQLGRAYQGAAWLMSTCPDARFRNSEMALEAAQSAITNDGEGDYRYLDTMAAAQASAGQFEQAQETLTKAIKKAPESEQERLKSRLDLYKEGKPYRQ